MIELLLSKILVDEKRSDQIVILREKKGKRFLPLVIGLSEAQSIQLKVRGVEPPRPLTHDLFLGMIQGLDAKLKNVVIDRMDQFTFYAKMNVLKVSGEITAIDARPSDCIAVAIRAGVPIFAEADVMKTAAQSAEGKE